LISLAFTTPLETRLGICFYKIILLRRPDDYWFHTNLYPPHFTIKFRPCLHLTANVKLSAFQLPETSSLAGSSTKRSDVEGGKGRLLKALRLRLLDKTPACLHHRALFSKQRKLLLHEKEQNGYFVRLLESRALTGRDDLRSFNEQWTSLPFCSTHISYRTCTLCFGNSI